MFIRVDSSLPLCHDDRGPYDWMNPSTAYIYMKYALGTYGWMWYLYSGFWNGLCQMKKNLFCCSCIRFVKDRR